MKTIHVSASLKTKLEVKDTLPTLKKKRKLTMIIGFKAKMQNVFVHLRRYHVILKVILREGLCFKVYYNANLLIIRRVSPIANTGHI